MNINRREFMQSVSTIGLSTALFPRWMPRLAFRDQRKAARGDTLIVVSLRGGMDALSVVVPFAEGKAYYDNRPTLAIPAPGKGATSALDLDGRFGLHPALKPLYGLYQDKKLAVVHAVGSPDKSRSHFQQMEVLERGTAEAASRDSGWINRYLSSTASQVDSPFRAVGLGDMLPTSLLGSAPVLSLRSIADYHLNGHEGQPDAMKRALENLYTRPTTQQRLGTTAKIVLSTMETVDKFSPEKYVPANNAKYPETDFGLALSQIAQFIKADVGLEVACVDLGGWDTHENQRDQIAGALGRLASGLAAFTLDLRERMDDITIVTMSEFGRRLRENASRGTDHGHGGGMFVIGGGVNGGVHTRWPGLSADALVDGDLAITTDFRDVISEILAMRMNNPETADVFPGYQPSPRGIMKPRGTS